MSTIYGTKIDFGKSIAARSKLSRQGMFLDISNKKTRECTKLESIWWPYNPGYCTVGIFLTSPTETFLKQAVSFLLLNGFEEKSKKQVRVETLQWIQERRHF